MSLSRCFLRSRIESLTINLHQADNRDFIGLPPDICWAAELAEYEMVEVVKDRSGQTFSLPVLFSEQGKVSVSGPVSRYLRLGDQISVSCHVLLNEGLVAAHRTSFVEVTAENVPTEIRRRPARVVPAPPGYFPSNAAIAESPNAKSS